MAALALSASAGTAAVAAGPAGTAAAATCTAPSVKVMVDYRPHTGVRPTPTWPVGFQGNGSAGNLVTACVPFEAGMTGYSLLQTGGFTLAGTQHDGPAFICRINNLPAPSGNPGARTSEPCSLTPPATAYWSYWHADPGDTSWEYSQLGVMSYHSVPGSVEVWEYGPTDIQGTYGQPTFTPQSVMPAAAPAGATAPAAPGAGGNGGVIVGPQPTGTEGGGSTGGTPSSGSAPSDTTSSASGTTSGPAASSSGAKPVSGAASSAATTPGGSGGTSSSGTSGAPDSVDIDAIAEPAGTTSSGTPWATLATVIALAVAALVGGGVAWRREAGVVLTQLDTPRPSLPMAADGSGARPAPLARSPRRSARLPRDLHPMAWWAWAIGLAAAASRTTNPLLLLLILAAAGVVVVLRRTDAPWARAFRYYLFLGLTIIVIRIVFRVLFGGVTGGGDGGLSGMHVLFRMWEIPLPSWMAGVHLGGTVTAESLLGAVYDGVRLATLLCCIGAANALANPKRALRAIPGALYEIGVAVVVAISVAPQLVESVQRVHRARKLRGGAGSGLRALRSIAMPVLQDALERSLLLAAAMDSRGYGRRVAVPAALRRTTAALLVAGLLGLCVGAYGVLDGTSPALLGLPALVVGAAMCVGGITLGGRRVAVTTYRPDPWRLTEWAVLACGLGCAVIMIVSSSYDSANLNPSLSPLSWPTLPLLPVLAIVIAASPAFVSPPPVTPASRRRAGEPA